MRVGGNFLAANANQIFRATDHAGGGAANLNMRHAAHGLQLEHEIEGRDFQGADIGHAEHISDIFNRRLAEPPFLFLCAPQQGNNRRSLTSFGVFGDLRLSPCLIFRGKGKAIWLFRMKASEHRKVFRQQVERGSDPAAAKADPRSAVNLTKHNIKRPKNSRHIRQLVAAA